MNKELENDTEKHYPQRVSQEYLDDIIEQAFCILFDEESILFRKCDGDFVCYSSGTTEKICDNCKKTYAYNDVDGDLLDYKMRDLQDVMLKNGML